MNKVVLFILIFAISVLAQYNADIERYDFYVKKLTAGQTVPQDNYYLFRNDTTVVFSWTMGAPDSPSYISPYTGQLIAVWAIFNTPEIWAGTDSASTQRIIALEDGLHEITAKTVAINQQSSGFSFPIFVEIRGIYANVIIELKIRAK